MVVTNVCRARQASKLPELDNSFILQQELWLYSSTPHVLTNIPQNSAYFWEGQRMSTQALDIIIASFYETSVDFFIDLTPAVG